MQQPCKADEFYHQGLQHLRGGKHAEAEAAFRAVLRDKPDWADAHNNLGVALANRGEALAAVEAFHKALEFKPDYAEAHNNLGNGLRRLGKTPEAIDYLKEAVRLRPGWVNARNDLGMALRANGKLDEAIEHFRQGLRVNQQNAEVRNNLGVSLADKGLPKQAAAHYKLALRDKPQSAETHNNLGVMLAQLGDVAGAVACYQKALELRPKYADAHNNLGNALRQQGNLEAAEASLREALRQRPDYAEAYNNLAIVLVKQERMEEAIANYRQALRLKPDYPDAHKNLALALLGCEEYPEGWREYEQRWQTRDMPAREFTQPRWDGSPLDGKTILLYAEQGLGDTMQFIRYAAMCAERGGKVLVECQKPLVPLLARCPGIFRLIPHGETLPDFDVQAPLMSLPLIFRTDRKTIPDEIPYLSAEPDRLRQWGEELKGLTGFKIGIAWQGSKGYQDDAFRSIRLSNFEPIARVPGVRLISLQKGFGQEQLAGVRSWGVLDFGKKLDEKGAFLDSAAIMKHLDLVITSDSALAHLAGGLGVLVWLAVSKAPDWRWLLEGEDSNWYPTMKLFRQSKRGEGAWREVFERMARELEVTPALESAERYSQRGLAFLQQGKHAEAAVLLRRGIELEPRNAILHNNLAIALDGEGKRPDAIAGFREAVRLKADYGDAWHNLGNLLRRQNQLAEAEECYRKAMPLLPNSADLYNHLGIALLGQAKHGEAQAAFRRALRLKPEHAEAHNNLGVLHEQQGQLDEATACYQESLRIKPDSADTRKNLALGWLMRGEYARGFKEYECRLKCTQAPPRSFTQPRWDGGFLDGKSILLYAEQGLGDTIQFIRYARLVQERGGHVLVECPAVLERLLSRYEGIDRIVPQGAPLPEFACQVPFLSLPAIFHTTLDNVPAAVPYLSAEPARVAAWGKEFAELDGLTIGIAWQGSQRYGGDAHRSIALKEFAPLAELPGVRLVSLQKGYGAEQLKECGPRWNVLNFGDRLDADGAFVDAAAIMSHLDVVITSDTAIAHLAGALGVRTWLALSMAADWRWLREGDETPWYPTLRLFRQKQWGDWADVFARMAAALPQARLGLRAPVQVEIAPGELIDKITILEIKRERFRDEAKLHNVRTELGTLFAVRGRSLKPSRELARLTEQLRAVNEALWQIEEEIRVCEAQNNFGKKFVKLARQVPQRNDERAALKRQINELLGSRIVEEKSYVREESDKNSGRIG